MLNKFDDFSLKKIFLLMPSRGLFWRIFQVLVTPLSKTFWSNDRLKHKVVDILGMVDLKMDDYEIQRCHRVPRKNGTKPTIIKFTNRKVPEAIMANKSQLKDFANIGIPQDAILYFFLRWTTIVGNKNEKIS